MKEVRRNASHQRQEDIRLPGWLVLSSNMGMSRRRVNIDPFNDDGHNGGDSRVRV